METINVTCLQYTCGGHVWECKMITLGSVYAYQMSIELFRGLDICTLHISTGLKTQFLIVRAHAGHPLEMHLGDVWDDVRERFIGWLPEDLRRQDALRQLDVGCSARAA